MYLGICEPIAAPSPTRAAPRHERSADGPSVAAVWSPVASAPAPVPTHPALSPNRSSIARMRGVMFAADRNVFDSLSQVNGESLSSLCPRARAIA